VSLLLGEGFRACEAPGPSRTGTRAAAVESHPQYAATLAKSGFVASTDPTAFSLLICSSSSAKRFSIA
jgi:hypothetical protein